DCSAWTDNMPLRTSNTLERVSKRIRSGFATPVLGGGGLGATAKWIPAAQGQTMVVRIICTNTSLAAWLWCRLTAPPGPTLTQFSIASRTGLELSNEAMGMDD